MLWSELAEQVEETKALHDHAYPKSGMRTMHIYRYAPGFIGQFAYPWVMKFMPELLAVIDWTKPQVIIADVPGTASAAFIARADQIVTWGHDTSGTFAVPDYSFGIGNAFRRASHRIACCVPEVTGEYWCRAWGSNGPEGGRCQIEFDADGKPIETWL